ncbi:MAG: thiosulfate oxidation carrier protein SoxY [Rhizobiales bacterium]|nr:thiosulfate oxidation carrier protein SoxY [Hyphomicrobiales bacterium]
MTDDRRSRDQRGVRPDSHPCPEQVAHGDGPRFEARSPLLTTTRRTFLVAAGAAVLAARWLPFAAIPAQAAERVTWEDAMKALIGEVVPAPGRIALQMPEQDVGGEMVPFTVSVDSRMLESDYVKSVHVFATDNPRPEVASFFFSPLAGRAAASSRMRLVTTQEVVAVAEMSDGSVFLGRRRVVILPAVAQAGFN